MNFLVLAQLEQKCDNSSIQQCLRKVHETQFQLLIISASAFAQQIVEDENKFSFKFPLSVICFPFKNDCLMIFQLKS